MPYGSATVRPYVGAVKRVALPIVALAINRAGAAKSTVSLCPLARVAQLLGETTYQHLPSARFASLLRDQATQTWAETSSEAGADETLCDPAPAGSFMGT